MEALRRARPPRARSTARPNEVPDAIPFDRDEVHRVLRPRNTPTGSGGCWCRPTACSKVSARASSASAARCISSGALPTWRSRASPGGRAPQHPGGIPNLPDWVAREAYSHEVSSCGFWPGGGPIRLRRVLFVRLPGAGRLRRRAGPAGRRVLQSRPARVHPAVRRGPAVADRRTTTLLDFLQTTYEAAANLAELGSRRAGTRRRSASPVTSPSGRWPLRLGLDYGKRNW